MKKFIAHLVLAGLVFSGVAVAKEPTNLASVKKDLIRYHDSGQYEKDINLALNEGIAYLKMRLAQPLKNNQKPAIVLDIDETSLSNYDNMRKSDFGGTLEEIRQAEDEGKDVAIKSTLKLYQFAKANNVSVFFITGRFEEERAATSMNLQSAGFSNWDGLTLRSTEYKHKPAALYKTAMRKQLSEQGYDIILNVGDQQSDLAGGYADKTLKLPNPYYFIP